MKHIREFFNNFKQFLLASTFVDVAIGLLIAGAVKDVATSFTDSFVSPVIMKLLSLIGVSASADAATTVFGIDFYIQPFITALITFVIIMFVAFTILESYAKMKERFAKEAETEEEIILSNEERLLAEIRDLLAEKKSDK